MTIEFHTQHAQVKESLVGYIRTEIMKMVRLHKEISRAEVTLKEDKSFATAETKICEIRLTIAGDDLMAYRRTTGFSNAAKEAIKVLNTLVIEEVKKSKEPPDAFTSTVKV